MNILVINDEADMQSLFEQCFRKEIRNRIVHFTFANSGKKALNYLYKHFQEVVLKQKLNSIT